MSEATRELVADCCCVYCLWLRAIGKALAEKMDREIMELARAALHSDVDDAAS